MSYLSGVNILELQLAIAGHVSARLQLQDLYHQEKSCLEIPLFATKSIDW